MKGVFFAVLAVLLVLSQADDTLRQFHRFMKQYQKQYPTAEEFQLRYNNFKASLERATKRNEQYKKGAQYGITKFSGAITKHQQRFHNFFAFLSSLIILTIYSRSLDMTPEEFQTTVLMKNKITPASAPRRPDQVLPSKEVSLPAFFDWYRYYQLPF